MTEHTEPLTITYESDGDRADAKAVGAGLLAVQAVIDEFHSACEENEKLLLKARPFAEGSLELPLDLIIFGAAILFQEDPLLQRIWKVISEYFDIKRRLKGQPIQVKDGNIVIIENSPIQVDQITLQCLDPQSTVSRKCSEAFQSIEDDLDIHAIRISYSAARRPLIRISREEFPYFHPEMPIDEQNLGQRHVESQEVLIIRQPSFDAELEWRFIWKERKIGAVVECQRFLENVQAGRESFVAGDRLRVDLRRLQEYDPAAKTYVDTKSFTITRVLEHIHRGEDGKLC